MKLIITIDTEEDNWGSHSPHGYTLENIRKIPALQDLFDEFGVRPTYLITYQVATDKDSIAILKEIHEKGRCEIGTHPHPWNTPPYEEVNTKVNSMLCNLSADLQFRKIEALHKVIQKNFNIEPLSFRSGRWAYNQDIAINLHKLEYKIDTSVTPYVDWTSIGGPDFSNFSPRPYRFSADDIYKELSSGVLLEVPATIGFLQSNFEFCNSLLKFLTSRRVSPFKINSILYKLGFLNKVWLSPEVSDSKTMIKLAKKMLKNNYKVINMVFHSSSLMAGLTPFVKTKADEEEFLKRIREFLIFANDNGIGSIRLSDSLEFL